MNAHNAVSGLLSDADLDPALMAQLSLTGAEPALPSSFAMGTVAQASIAAAGLASAEVWRLGTGRRQSVAVDMRHAAIDFRSQDYIRIDGRPAPESWDKIAGLYRCGDGRWIRIHTNFPHHRQGILDILGCAYDRAAVQAALMEWDAEAFETTVSARGFIATMTRSPAEWRAHPQGAALERLPVLTIERIGDAPPEPIAAGARPLSGLRVLDLTRVIAGPVCGRTLAAHGAAVLKISGPHLPSVEALVIDNGRGKRSAFIDLRQAEGRAVLNGLVGDADIFVQGYRPGAIAGHGFAPADLARLRPGIVAVSLSAYGHEGPWSGRRGFDSIVQNVNGIDHAEAEAAGAESPKALPCQALDHAAGYLMAFGAMAALARRAVEGGSWLVQTSLAQAGRWIVEQGRIENGFACPMPGQDDVADLLEESESGFGRLTAVRHAALLSETPAHWRQPNVPLGTHDPVWR